MKKATYEVEILGGERDGDTIIMPLHQIQFLAMAQDMPAATYTDGDKGPSTAIKIVRVPLRLHAGPQADGRPNAVVKAHWNDREDR